MEYRTLKNSDLTVSSLAMGGCPMGGYGWGEVRENELIDAVRTALDYGITFYDTADTYGLGKSEEVLGKALGSDRLKVAISTKFGVRIENGKTTYDNSPAWIEYSVKNSLKRLGTDYIDLYQIHYRDKKTPLGEVVEKLEELKQKGYIRYFGLSNIHVVDLLELKACIGKFVSLQEEFSLACIKNEHNLTAIADELQVTPMTWGSLGQGILTGKYNEKSCFKSEDRRSRATYVNFHGEKLLQNLNIVKIMKPIAEKYHVSVSAVAVRYILDYLRDSVVLVGAKTPSQICGSIESIGWKLEAYEIAELCRASNV